MVWVLGLHDAPRRMTGIWKGGRKEGRESEMNGGIGRLGVTGELMGNCDETLNNESGPQGIRKQ